MSVKKNISPLTTIAFDADDTLWENEQFFRLTQDRFAALLADHSDPDHLGERLLAAERRNLGHYGFGVKGFVLSMIETAIEVTEQRVPAAVIAELIAMGQEMLAHPIHLLDGADAITRALAKDYHLLLITKGDLLDQERKLAQSGLGDRFDGVEIVSDKTPRVYADLFARRGLDPARTLMLGNSMKSDVVAPIDAGAWGVFVPHGTPWALEVAQAPTHHPRFRHIDSLRDLPLVLDEISTAQSR
ncbi:haloacid dehalogenase-like hydrolase [Aquimixticola soesokkakensis]|uniref:Haloacid dehalogenase-like hydrolase n=1 Tax=Aquimixticola soesokkakensis TaxID=1519096 RepID=A0A1Y5SVU8_9RHOB|nr:HAD family hydrolase [Aquimixticola soesokkakensis]SLN47752.1 haloacid dehalogenase-like hydrolase [Aquimixticola soesokkakensis]